MPHQNKVTPLGDIITRPERGLFTGNRGGQLHDAGKRIVEPYHSKRWIICALQFKGCKAQIMAMGHYTHLFFLDEAVALAAGHRPCFECRRERAEAFQEAWLKTAPAGVDRSTPISELDEILHAERYTDAHFKWDKQKKTYEEPYSSLPDGAFVLVEKMPYLIWRRALYLWTPGSYCAPIPIPSEGSALTPPTTVRAIRSGYVPIVHGSAL